MNSNKVLRFSGDGAVTKILLNWYTIAPANASPSDADLPLPLPAVKLKVYLRFFSEIESTIDITALAWSKVLHLFTSYPIGLVSFNSFFKFFNYFYSSVKYKFWTLISPF